MAQRVQVIATHVNAAPLCMQPTSGQVMGRIGTKTPDDVVIVSALRTPVCRANKGGFKDTQPDDLLIAALQGVMKESGIKHEMVKDIRVGNAQLQGAYQGPARMAQLRAGFPASTALNTVNRQCSSGLQAVADVANAIRVGMIDVGIGAGVESMTQGGAPAIGNMPSANMDEIMKNKLARDCLVPMGVTAENVAERFGISRDVQDQMGVESHEKALRAQAEGRFKSQIVPVSTTRDGKPVVIEADDGPRKTTLATLQKLKPVFKKDGGSVTAGSSSQISDGAAAVLMMRRAKAEQLGLKPLAVYRGASVVGVEPDIMGVGPAAAIPLVLQEAGITIADVDIFEINEAFAAQALFCVQKLGVPREKLNPNGGAIALGHPLGCTGARQIATLLHEMRRTNKRIGLTSMCVGTGMGMAAVFEHEL
eukprot:TRINITY_DN4118_c0_g2_i1.p1 TRINITY_DN4118_c0_g2~~TRINITY_DN4118_c0_g2_i1.p1  ORF type:complete len:422 (+),score=100.04 TRINITY_DN4118_c0_g2_i1:97-1362(+)